MTHPSHVRLKNEREEQDTMIPLESHHCFNSEPIVGGSSKWDKKPLICVANSSVITSVSTDTTSSHFPSERSWLILTRNCNAGFPALPSLSFSPTLSWCFGLWKRGNKTQLFDKITDALVTCFEDKENIKTCLITQKLESSRFFLLLCNKNI